MVSSFITLTVYIHKLAQIICHWVERYVCIVVYGSERHTVLVAVGMKNWSSACKDFL